MVYLNPSSAEQCFFLKHPCLEDHPHLVCGSQPPFYKPIRPIGRGTTRSLRDLLSMVIDQVQLMGSSSIFLAQMLLRHPQNAALRKTAIFGSAFRFFNIRMVMQIHSMISSRGSCNHSDHYIDTKPKQWTTVSLQNKGTPHPFNRVFLYKPSILGYPYFRKPPY